MTVGSRTLRYDPATYFVMSVDLPAVGALHPSEEGHPYLAVSLTLTPAIIASLLADLPVLPGAMPSVPAFRSPLLPRSYWMHGFVCYG